MLYAKEDLYAYEGDVRKQIAFAGQLIPQEFEHLVEAGDVSEAPVVELVEASAEPAESIGAPPATVDATDAAVELANANGIDLTTVEGTGKDGRVLEGDVKKLVEASAEPAE
jgi:pyruvate/2-oxoglutarate dehydrogenase complex dihydrolipoamide acyltransferase (E2) component